MSKPPPGGGARVGKVCAIRAGADGPAEMLAELGMVLTDPGYRVADRAGHSDSSTLGRGCGSSIATTQANRARELSNEEVAFGIGLRRPFSVPEGARFLYVVFDLGEAPAVGVLGSRVEDLPGIAERVGQAGRAATDPRILPCLGCQFMWVWGEVSARGTPARGRRGAARGTAGPASAL
jgi:hypothetical protein